ncbi:MAG: hypothetical protein A2Y17_06050 [Clostridiales bacterium GWF2_38_85]|nr:MAG: hypothetical protein A2Y17_06050 [Clostridiales bacterium GWF2_38_85]HBL83557.1 hypothetical protein [Clostridiales bacterium]
MGFSINNIEISKMQNYTISINKSPFNPTWTSNNDFIWERISGSSYVASINSLGVITGLTTGIITIKATHKITGLINTFTIKVLKEAIIVIPGYMGTELYLEYSESVNETVNGINYSEQFTAGTKIWPPIEEDVTPSLDTLPKLLLLKCDTDGIPKYDLTPVSENNSPYGAYDAYETLITRLNTEYSSQYDIRFFPYDWRRSNSRAGNLLDSFITTNSYDKVIIIAHSNGGLVASNYLSKGVSQRNKVEKFITLGSPLLGSLEVARPIVDGYIESIADVPPFISDNFVKPILQSIIVDLPSAYELLPTPQFFSEPNRSYLTCNLFQILERHTTYNDTITHLEAHIENWNTDLMSSAENVNSLLYINGQHITTLVPAHYIVGWGTDTISEYQYNIDVYGLGIQTKETTPNGDNTVLSFSASLNDAYSSNTYYSSDTSHAISDIGVENGLLKLSKVWDTIKNIINTPNGSTVTLPSGISHEVP